MRLKKLYLENIRSYVREEIEFPEGSTLLSGDIGSGKTSILLAIEFALFGLQPGQRGSSLLRNGANSGKVRLEFEIEGDEIIIERSLRRGKSVSQDRSLITINGKSEELAVTELKNKVLKLLNYPSEFAKKQNLLYKFTVYTPQEEMKQIIIQDPESRMNTLRHVFGIDKYKVILENSLILLSKIREEKRLKEALIADLEQHKLKFVEQERELETSYGNLDSLEKELFSKEEKRKRIQEQKQEIAEKVEEKKRFIQEIDKTKLMISSKREAFSSNLKLLEQLKGQIDELERMRIDESRIIQIEKEILWIEEEKEKLDQKNLEINSEMNSLKAKNEENLKLEQRISNLEICPTCLQDVDAIYRANVLNKIRSEVIENNKKLELLETEKAELLSKMKELSEKLSLKRKELTDMKILKAKYQSIEEKRERMREIERSNELLKRDIDLLEKHMKILQDSVFKLGKFDKLFEEIESKLEEALHEEKLIEIKIAELKKEISLKKRQLEELKKRIEEGEKTKKEFERLSALEEWISNIFMPLISLVERNVMIRLKEEFSQLFSKWFSMLVSDSLNVRLGEDFTPIVEQQDYEIDYAYLSGGERTAIALAYRLALNQVINSILSKIKTKDLVILDEPTDGFSDQQLDRMRDVLQELNVSQLILVSHEQKIESFVDHVLRFRKEDGISKLVRGGGEVGKEQINEN